MKQFFLDLLAEKSTISSMRFLALASLAIGGSIAWFAVIAGKDLPGTAELCAVFVGASFGGKVGQKWLEVKQEKTDKD